jgi:putative ABC transport system substrate-binding protein
MKRREFLTVLAGATAWPLGARAQQPRVPVIGYLSAAAPEAAAPLVAAFRKGLSEAGYVEGRNVAIEYYFAHHDLARLPDMAADLVGRQVAVIVAPGSTPAALAAKAATTTIPVIFQIGGDPVQIGLVASFNRPGGNVTGIASMNVELGAKRLGLLHELLPAAARFAVLVNPDNPTSKSLITDAQAAASTIGRKIEALAAGTNREIDAAFATLPQKRTDALLVSPDTLFLDRRVQLVTLAARHAVPTIYPYREHAEIGGLMSYGVSVPEIYRLVGLYTGRILKGEKPGDLPVMQAAKFEFIINLQSARTIGIEVPPDLLSLADEVIE